MSQSPHVFYSLRLPPVTNADRTGMPLAMAGPTQGHLAVGLAAKLLRPLETVGSGTLLYAFDQLRCKANVRRSFHNGSLARLRVVEGKPNGGCPSVDSWYTGDAYAMHRL